MVIKNLTSSIEKALEENNHYSALFITLAMPDICGKIEFPNKRTDVRIKNWFDNYLSDIYQTEIGGELIIFMNSSNFYALRCAILHEASEDISKQDASDILMKIKFTLLGVHRIRTENVLTLNVNSFCKEVIAGVERWLLDVSDDNEIMERISTLLKIENTGFNPIPGVRIG